MKPVTVYADLADDSYTLTLVSGAEAFRDTVGHGLEGGNLEIHFGTYVDDVPLSTVPIGPAEGGACVASAVGTVSGSSADTYAISTDAGKTISVSLEPDSDLQATIELLNPDGSLYASATAASVGEAVSLRNLPTTVGGIYSIAVRGAGGSAGDYRVHVLQNAVHEDLTLDEAAVENLDNWFLPLEGQGDQIVVYGALHAIGESFDAIELDDSWYLPGEPVAFLSDEWGSVDGDSVLMMHGAQGGASWEVDVSEIDNPILSFWHASWEGAGQSLHWTEFGLGEDDGVVVDGIAGETANKIHKWIPPEQVKGQWVHYSLNLTDIAEQNGEALASQYKFHFQQVDWYDGPGPGYTADRLLPEAGRGWDAILVTSADPIGDWYEFSLDDGETASLAMIAEGMPADSVLELYDDAGNLLATGQADADGGLAIEGFRDTTTDGAADKYHVRVGAVVTTPEWPYSLVITRNAESGIDNSPFEIAAVSVGTETVGTVPTLDVTFSDDLAIGSLEAADFQVNGVPAESVRVFNSRTVRVQSSVLTPGSWDVQIAGGALADIQGTPLTAYSGSVTVSANDALLSDGLLHETQFLGELDGPGQTDSWQVQLGAGQRMTVLLKVDEALAGSVRLLGPDGAEVAAEAAAVGELVVVEYTATSAGAYTLAVSGANGTQGEYEGSLYLNAIVDPETLFYTPFESSKYIGGHNLIVSGDLDSPGKTEETGIGLVAGQTVTITTKVGEDLAGSVRLLGPDGSEVAAKTGAAGETIVIEYTATVFGTYPMFISGLNGTMGKYESTVLGDPVHVPGTLSETEENSAASAIDLDPVFFDIADGAQAAAVHGVLQSLGTFEIAQDFQPGEGSEPEMKYLMGGWWTDANRGELPRPRLGYGEGILSFPAGVYKRIGDPLNPRPEVPGYYEANWSPFGRGILPGDSDNPVLFEFDFRVSDPDVRFTPFSGTFTNETAATGIAITNDEVTWYPVWNAPQQTAGEWVRHSIDLSAAAEAAGLTLSSLTRIRFQYHAELGTEGTGPESMAFDNLVISDRAYTEDWYRFDLQAGQTVAAVVDSNESIQIDLLDSQSNVIASGVDGAGVQQVIDQVAANGSGTYYLRATGTGGKYSLAVARDVAAGWGPGVTVPEYVVGSRLAEHTIPPTTDIDPVDPGDDTPTPTDGPYQGYGQLGAPIEFGTPVSETDLGTVLHREVTGLDLSGGTLSFRLQPTHTAYMTVIGDAGDSGTLHLKLRDPVHEAVLYSVDVDGEQRLDMPADDDRTYILEVTGTATNVNLELLNLVYRRNASVRVYGTDDADHFGFDATSGVDVLIQGIAYPFRDFEELDVSFEGGSGDKVTLIGSAGDEEIRLTPSSGEMTGAGWQVSICDVTSYEVVGGGGSDTAYLTDSAGDDRYESRPGLTTLKGPGFDMKIYDFEECHGYAKAGGVDTAVLYTPEGSKSKFKSDAEVGYAKVYGTASFTRAKFFEIVEAYNRADLGVARMFDSRGDDRFFAQESQSRMITPEYDFTVHGFTQLIACRTAGGHDTAILSDSVAHDEVRVRGFIKLDADFEENDGTVVDQQGTPLGGSQQVVVAPNTDTAALQIDDQTFDPLILAEAEVNNTIATANPVPLGFEPLESQAIRIEGDLSGTDSSDVFRLELDAGDVFSARLSGGAERVAMLDSRGVNLIRSAYDAGWNAPENSPLVGAGRAAVSWVVSAPGHYYVRISEGTGEYDLDLQVLRPKLESEPIGTRQILFLDFDGASVDTSEFHPDGDVRELSPLVDFISDLGLDAEHDLDAIIDAIVATVEENLSLDVRQSGLNGDFDASGHAGEFDIEILNSRDHGEQFGNAYVSRVVIGGTVEQFGIHTVGLTPSIDVGNFDTEETAVVLLDMLTDPDPPSWNTASLNAVPIDPSADKIDLVGRAIGNIASHEAGHLFANWHTWNDNHRNVLMDTGGNYTAGYGLGPDGIFGTADDVDVDFGYDVFSPSEPYQGMQDSLVGIAFGLSTGTQGLSGSSVRGDDDSAD